MPGIEDLSHCTFLAAGYILCLIRENAERAATQSQCSIKILLAAPFVTRLLLCPSQNSYSNFICGELSRGQS